MSIYHPTGATLIKLISELSAMASSVDDAIAGLFTTRQAQSYVWGDAIERSQETGMTPGSTGAQLDSGGIYTYLNGQWLLTGGTLPTFTVKGTGSQSMPTGGTATTFSSLWGTPDTNHGFSAWSGGVLTVQEAGVYLLNGSAAFNAADLGNRYLAIAQSGFTSDASTAFYLRDNKENLGPGGDVLVSLTTFAPLTAGATIKLAAWQTSGSTIDTDTSQPGQNRMNVRYLGPLI